MYFRQFLDDLHGCASYLIASRASGEAAIVDPSLALLEAYQEVLAARGFALRYAIDTHLHADHISAARDLVRGSPGAELCLYESAPAAYPFRGLRDGEELALGPLRLRVLHTPGHRMEHMAVLVSNLARGAEPALVLTGDALFAGDVGRPDFGGGDAAAQYASVQRLLGLPEWVAVFPGHFEGPCGKAMEGRAVTTVGFERRFNPLARLDQQRFIASITADVPARPLNMTAIEATNRGQADQPWAMLVAAPEVPQVEVEALAERPAAAVVLDVREPEEYERGHVPGAISLPQAELAARLAEVPREGPLFVICRSGARSLRSTQFLHSQGIRQAVNVRGGTEAWRGRGAPLARGTEPGG